MHSPGLDSLDAVATLAAAERVLLRRRAVEVEDLELVAHWAVLHGADPTALPSGRVAGGDRLVQVGGEGTPRVRELCLGELAIVRRVHPGACRRVMGEVLDLQHRLPAVWLRVVALEAEAWVARRVAVLTRDLPLAAVRAIEACLAEAVVGQAPSRVFALTQAKVVEADPEAHAVRLEAEQRRRYVSLSRADEFGLRHVIARVHAGDAVWIDATVQRVADLLAPGRPDATRDELRSAAFGWLARPAELLALLLAAGEPDELAWSRSTAFPADLLDALRRIEPSRLRPPATLYVHLHQSALSGVCSHLPASRARVRCWPASWPTSSVPPTSRSCRSSTSPTGSARTPTSTPRRSGSGCSSPRWATTSRTPRDSAVGQTSTTRRRTGPPVHPVRPAPTTPGR